MPNFKSFKALALAGVVAISGGALISTAPVTAHNHKSHGEAAQPNIVQAAAGTGVHNTLVAAVKAAGLVETLSGPGPFTIFAPTDTAFAKLPEGTVATLVKPENKGTLTGILTYHAVAGNVSAADLTALITKHNGTATIETLGGGKLTARLSGDMIVITDAAGRATAVTQADVKVSNGVIHVTDGVFLPG